MPAGYSGEITPTTAPSCFACKQAKRLVWVLYEGEVRPATKCKCGLSLIKTVPERGR